MPTYSFSKCLENSYKVNWKISDVLGGKRFDPAKSWLPAALSGTSRLPGLGPDARRKLTHIEMAAYAHLFGGYRDRTTSTYLDDWGALRAPQSSR